MSYFQDKVSIVTGAAAGIGEALVRALANKGASVVAADVNMEMAQRLADSLSQKGQNIIVCESDVRCFEDLKQVVGRAVDEFGRLDLMINNAGVGLAGEMRDLELADWKPIIDVNLWGVIHGVHAALPVMLDQESGQIVNIASAAGLVPRPGMVPYATSKYGVVGLTTSLRYEVEDLGIRVNAVCPFNVATSVFKNTVYKNLDHEAMLEAIPLRQLPVQQCVEQILTGVRRNRPIITMPRYASFEWWLYRMSPAAASILLRRRRNLFRNHRRSDSS